MRFKVGPDAPTTLCASCEHGMVFERRTGAMAAYCHASTSPVVVPLDIVRCSDYEGKRRVSRYELEKIAWTIRHDKSGAIRGFEPPPKKVDGR